MDSAGLVTNRQAHVTTASLPRYGSTLNLSYDPDEVLS